jgi:hypothetical protein
MASHIGRRRFLATLGGVAAAWPVAVRAQQGARMRRIGVLSTFASDDPAQQSRVAPSGGAALWRKQIESL